MTATTSLVATRRLDARTNATGLLGASVVLAVLLPASPVTQLVGATGLLVLLGATVGSMLTVRDLSLPHRICICVGCGFLVFSGLGAGIGWVLPHLGVDHPLTRTPLAVTWLAVDAVVVATSLARRRDPVRDVFGGLTSAHAWWAAILGLPVLLSLYGAVHLNDGGSAMPAVLAAALACGLAIAAFVLPNGARLPPRVLLLSSAFLSGALQGPLRGGWLAGVDIQHEYFVAHLAAIQGVFPLQHYSDPYGGMLSLTVFPAELHALFGLTLRGILAFVPSMFLVLALLATWATVRERLSPRASVLLCVLFVVGCEPLLRQLPQVTRQCYALFFFALLVMAVTSTRLPVRTARLLACASAAGIAITHYTSAYFAALAVLFGCACTYLLRTERSQRVFTLPVTAVVVGIVALWDAAVAKSQSNVVQLFSAIRKDGLRLLPGKGSVWTRFFHGSTETIGSVLNGPVFGRVTTAASVHPDKKHAKYGFMIVLRAAEHVAFRAIETPTVTGFRFFGSALYDLGTALTELVLVAAVVAVAVCIWRSRNQRALAGVAGVGLCFLGISALSRFSGTVSVDFGPSRVEAQAYLLFVAIAAVGLERLVPAWATTQGTGSPRAARHRASGAAVTRGALVVGAVLAALSICTATELSNLAEPGAQPPAELSATGQQADRLLTPNDEYAAGWLAVRRSARSIIQSDLYGANALDVFGFNTRRNFFDVVDPVIVDNRSWLLADRTNVVDRIAFQSSGNPNVTAYDFPLAYFVATRSVLYVSPTDAVFGQVPHDNWGPVTALNGRSR